MFQKKATNIYIIKSQNLKMGGGGGKSLRVLIKLMNQNFSKSKILHESSKLEHFQWGCKNFGSTNLRGGVGGGKNFGRLKSLDFQRLPYF